MAKLKSAKEALQESEERFRLMAQNMPVLINAFDENGSYLFWNRKCEEITGYSEKEIIGNTDALKLLYPDESYLNQLMEEWKERGSSFINWEMVLTCKDGSRKIVSWSNISDDYPIHGWASWAIGIDVTERKKTEKQLNESEERYRLLFETSRDAIMTLAPPSWNFTSGNPATLKLFGVKDEETFVSAPPWKYSPESQPDGQSSANKAKKMIDIAMERGTNFFEWTHKKLNSGDFFATVLLTRMSIGEKTFLQATVRDITERKKAEEELKKYREHLEDIVHSRTAKLKSEISKREHAEQALKESETYYRTMIKNANDWIWVVDTQGNFVIANNQAKIASGYKAEDWKGKSFAPLIYPDDLKMVNEVFRKTLLGRRQQYTVRIYDKNGKIIILSVNTAPIYKMGKIDGTVSFGRNITESKQAEKALQRQKSALEQKNIALSEIIAQIEVEKRKIKNDIAANVNELVFPILEKLKLKNATGKYVDLLKIHLEELVSSFGRKIRGKRLNLTPREIEICNMIKGRLTSKEISELLNISYQTVEKHRKNIRRKMGISKKDINLTSFLQTI